MINPPIPKDSQILLCPQSKIPQTHSVKLEGKFTTEAQTIVPIGEKPFPITLNVEDLEEMNQGIEEVLCRVLERRGIGAGKTPPSGDGSNLQLAIIELGPGLKLTLAGEGFHIPPAEKGVELLTNFEHSLDRLLETQKK